MTHHFAVNLEIVISRLLIVRIADNSAIYNYIILATSKAMFLLPFFSEPFLSLLKNCRLQPVFRIAIICCLLLNAAHLAISIILATSKATFLLPLCSKSFLSLLQTCRLPLSSYGLHRVGEGVQDIQESSGTSC